MPDLFPAASVAAMAHAELEYPKESVGVITPDGEYVPLVNVSRDPENYFEISEADDIEYATLDDDGKPKVAAILHSECYARGKVDATLIGPSKADMEQCIATKCPWGLIPVIGGNAEKPLYWGDPLILEVPLLGRPFVPQITDCYSAIRSFYYQVYKTVIPDFPRDWNWWRQEGGGDNFYDACFDAAGFDRIDMDDVAPGDVVFAQLRSPVPNHAVIVLDRGLMYHHPQGMLSAREPFGRWRFCAVGAVRHKMFAGKPPPLPPEELSASY